jgi:putative RecB family exonuclease
MERHTPQEYDRDKLRGRLTFSASRLDTFTKCRNGYRLQYLEKLRPHQDDRGQAMKTGSAVHAVPEEICQKIIEADYSGQIPVDRVLELFSRKAALEGVRGLDWYALGEDCLSSWAMRMGFTIGRSILGVESFFCIDSGVSGSTGGESLGPDDGIPLIGYIDRIDLVDDTTVAVVDYKTGRMMPSREDVETSLQLGIYAWAAFELYPQAQVVECGLDMLRHGEIVWTRYTRNSVEQVKRYVRSLIRAIVQTPAEDMRPQLNTLCSYCSVKDHCDAYAAALTGAEGGVRGDLSDPQATAMEKERLGVVMSIIKARAAEVDQALKQHLDTVDEIAASEKKYTLGKRRSYTFNEKAIARYEERTGQPGAELMAVDKKKLKAAVNAWGKENGKAEAEMLMVEMEAAASKRTTTYLQAKKKGADDE